MRIYCITRNFVSRFRYCTRLVLHTQASFLNSVNNLYELRDRRGWLYLRMAVAPFTIFT
jgi:hypothetical protein